MNDPNQKSAPESSVAIASEVTPATSAGISPAASAEMAPDQIADPVNFKAATPQQFAALDPTTKDRIVRARHLGIIRASEKPISDALKHLLTTPRNMPDGSILPPYRHEDLVVGLFHRDDPFTPPELKATLETQGLEVAILPAERLALAEGISTYVSIYCANCKEYFTEGLQACNHCGGPIATAPKKTRPYMNAGNVLKSPSPPNTVYVIVFDSGMCTVLFLGFDEKNGSETVPVDPNVAAPKAVEPLPVAPKKAIGG